jgi:hypothetical protein
MEKRERPVSHNIKDIFILSVLRVISVFFDPDPCYPQPNQLDQMLILTDGFFGFIYVPVLNSTLLLVPPLRFHSGGECLDRTQQDCCDSGIDGQTL